MVHALLFVRLRRTRFTEEGGSVCVGVCAAGLIVMTGTRSYEEACSGVDVSVRLFEMGAGDRATESTCGGVVAGSAQCITESRTTADY